MWRALIVNTVHLKHYCKKIYEVCVYRNTANSNFNLHGYRLLQFSKKQLSLK